MRLSSQNRTVEAKPPEHRLQFAFLLLVAVVFVMLVLRRPDAITNPQFWAEDGRLFFRDQLLFGTAQSVWEPYAGYLSVVPRLTAAFASLFPVVYAPLSYNVTALIVASISCSLFFLPAYRTLLVSDLLRLIVCIVLASAFFVHEVIGTITNVQWYLGLAALLILARPAAIDEQTSWLKAVLWGVACLLISLSAPTTIVLVPLTFFKILAARSSNARVKVWIAPACLLVGVAVQVVVFIFTSPISTQPRAFELHALLSGSLVALIYRVLLSSVAGHETAMLVSNSGWPVIIILTIGLTSAWLTWLILRAPAERRRTIAFALYVAFSSVLIVILGRDLADGFANLSPNVDWGGTRYFFLASCVLAYLVALSIEVLMPAAREVWKSVLLAMVFVAGMLGNFRVPAYYDYHWPEQAESVEKWYKNFRAGEPVKATFLKINPPLPGWAIMLPARGLSIEGFEGGPLGWSAYGSAADPSITTRTAHSGRHSLCQAGSGDGGLYQDHVGLIPGRKYRVSAWVTGDPRGTAGLWVHDTQGKSAVISPAISPNANWRSLEVVFTANEERMLRIHLQRAGVDSVCFDDVSVSELRLPLASSHP